MEFLTNRGTQLIHLKWSPWDATDTLEAVTLRRRWYNFLTAWRNSYIPPKDEPAHRAKRYGTQNRKATFFSRRYLFNFGHRYVWLYRCTSISERSPLLWQIPPETPCIPMPYINTPTLNTPVASLTLHSISTMETVALRIKPSIWDTCTMICHKAAVR